jgi:hypothetical protein
MMIRNDLEKLKADVHADGSDWSFSDQESLLERYVEVADSLALETTEA